VPDALDAPARARDALERRFTLAQLEELYINHVLEHTHGNKVRAAQILGINRRTLYRRGDRHAERDASDADAESQPDSESTTGRSR
jgi:DNA-binding NtrC family response regulator